MIYVLHVYVHVLRYADTNAMYAQKRLFDMCTCT